MPIDLFPVIYVWTTEGGLRPGRGELVEENLAYEVSFGLPDGYEVQLMVLQDYPGGKRRRGLTMSIFRSRIWIGRESDPEPLIHRSQEHPDRNVAIDSCYSMLLAGARQVVQSPAALAAIQERVHAHFALDGKPCFPRAGQLRRPDGEHEVTDGRGR